VRLCVFAFLRACMCARAYMSEWEGERERERIKKRDKERSFTGFLQ